MSEGMITGPPVEITPGEDFVVKVFEPPGPALHVPSGVCGACQRVAPLVGGECPDCRH